MHQFSVEELLKDYLSEDKPDFAVLFDGPWGSGKTFYFKTVIDKNWVKDKFTCIYVTLNGIASEYDVRNRVFQAISNDNAGYKLKSHLDKLAKLSPKIGIGFFSISPLSLLNFVNSFEINSANFDHKPLFIFDDLERIADGYDYKQIFGFLNTMFIEHKNIHTILLADVSKIETDKIPDFARHKEKCIRHSFRFTQDIARVVELLTDDLSAEFKIHITKHNLEVKTIVAFYRIDNIRTIKLALSHYKKIYHALTKYEFIVGDVINFVFIICVEFVLGNLKDYKSYQLLPFKIQQRDVINGIPLSSDDNQNYKSSYIEFENYFFKKYSLWRSSGIGKNIIYKFFPSIYQFVVQGSLDKERLNTEIYEHFKQKEINRNYKISNEISNMRFFRNMTHGEYQVNIDKLIYRLKNGKYNYADYVNAMGVLLEHHELNLLYLSLTDLKEILYSSYDKIRWNYYFFLDNLTLTRIIEPGLKRIKMLDSIVCEKLESMITEESNRIIIHRTESHKQKFHWSKNTIVDIRDIFQFLDTDNIVNWIVNRSSSNIYFEKIYESINDAFRPGFAHTDRISLIKPKITEVTDKLIIMNNTESLDKIRTFLLKELTEDMIKICSQL